MNVSGKLVILVGLLGGLSAGCHARVSTRVHYVERDVVVYDDPPELVLVDGDVYVVRDQDYAVYYVDGYYWSYRSNVWYRTQHYNDPWVTVHVHTVPGRISARSHHHYVRYHGHAGARTWREPARPRQGDRGREASSPRRHNDGGRDGRDSSPRSANADVDRDRRVDTSKATRVDARRDAKEERRDDRRDAKEERRDDRRDAKEERRDDRRDTREVRRDDRRDTNVSTNQAKQPQQAQQQPKKNAPSRKAAPSRAKKR